MSRGRHAAPKKYAPAVAAARTALVRTGACTLGLGLGWTMVTAAGDEGYLEVLAAGGEATGTGTTDTSVHDQQVRRITELNEQYGCSPAGLDAGVIPARAVVRVDRQVRLASFDEGWAMHVGETPGTLVSVCAR